MEGPDNESYILLTSECHSCPSFFSNRPAKTTVNKNDLIIANKNPQRQKCNFKLPFLILTKKNKSSFDNPTLTPTLKELILLTLFLDLP